jgi:protocatechuate 3,4-dioxygenase beta subunit
MRILAAGRLEQEQRVIGKNEDAAPAEVFPKLTRDVIDRMQGATSARLREVMAIVVRHLHAIVREAQLTQGEWWQAIDFLTRAGKMCSDSRQELILLSDILGVSMLVDAVDNVAGPGISDSTVLGPFYAGHQRELAQGDSILLREEASEPLAMSGRVTDPEGQPVGDALIEVWQTAPNQLYDVQDRDQPPGHLRASFRTDTTGAYLFRTILPVSYPIPDDGPAGQLLAAMGRHPFRPAHIHFMISAPGYRTLVTHLFFEGDEFLESDAVFGVKPSLVVRPVLKGGVSTVEYDFGLARELHSGSVRPPSFVAANNERSPR